MHKKARVLLVEDDVSQLQTLARRLDLKLGVDVVPCSTLEQAFGAIDGRTEFDSVITDMHFGSGDPEGGLRLLAFVRQKWGGALPVIVLTAYGRLDNSIRCMELGAFTYVEKGLIDDATVRLLVEKLRRAIDSRRNTLERIRQEAKSAEELAQARAYQLALLPKFPLHAGGWVASGWVEPTYHVGGDNIVVEPLAEGLIAFCLYDVSGHGVRSALISGMLRSTVEQCIKQDPNPEEVMRRLQDNVDYLVMPYYATLVYGVIFSDGLVRYFSAGHPYILIVAREGVARLQATGPVVQNWGLSLGRCNVGEAYLGDGHIVVFSDGLVEAEDSDGEQFGVEGVEKACGAAIMSNTNSLPAAIRVALLEHVMSVPVEDDCSVLVIRRASS